jgi:YD repeat-containing protein
MYRHHNTVFCKSAILFLTLFLSAVSAQARTSSEYGKGVTRETNGEGHTTEYYCRADNLIYKIVDANGGVTHLLYNEYEELETEVNPEGLSIKTEYDACGNPLTHIAVNQSERFQYQGNRIFFVPVCVLQIFVFDRGNV